MQGASALLGTGKIAEVEVELPLGLAVGSQDGEVANLHPVSLLGRATQGTASNHDTVVLNSV